MNEIERENNALLVFESAMARMEREHEKERDQWSDERKKHKATVRWMAIIIILLILIAAVSNFLWIRYENSFVDEEWTFEAEADDGSVATANGNGEVYYYGSKSKSNAP